MARTIQHVCLYCRRLFKGNSNRYITHIQKHRRRYHKGRYQLWKLDIGKLSKYSKHRKNQGNSTKDGNSFKQDVKKEATPVADSTAAYTLLPEDILFSPTPKKNNSAKLSRCRRPLASSSCFAPTVTIANPSPTNHDGFQTKVSSVRRLPTKTERKLYKCSFCEKSFTGGSHLLLHERTHTGEKPHSCRFCPKSFAQKGYLKIHERIHTGERPFKCAFCNKAFCTKEDLRRHERIHTGEKPYKCKVCDRGFSQRSYRNKHETIHNGQRPFASKPPNWDQMVDQGVNVDWDMVKPQLALLESLHGKADGTNGDIALSSEQLQSLNPTQQQTLPEGNLTSGRGRGRPKGSTNRQNYNCRFCSRDCRSSSQLKQHERTHTGEKPFTCRFCQKSFSQRGYARIHERIHTGEKPFPCQFCDKAFAAKEDLRRHQRTHTGEKPYKCELCSKAFAQNSALIGHRKTHLNEMPTTLDYSSHSFVGMQEPQINYPSFLEGGSNAFSSAHILQKMATEVGGDILNQNPNALFDNGKPIIKSESKTNKEIMSGFIPPQFLFSNQLPGLLNGTLADNKATDAKEMKESGSKKGINDIAARLMADSTVTDAKDRLESGSKKGINNIAARLLATRGESSYGPRVTNSQQNNIGATSSVDQAELANEYSFQLPTEAERLYRLYENAGVSIVDHIRMQLSSSNDEHPIQKPSPIEPTLPAHGKTFVNKKNKINNLASQLLSAKTQPTGLNLANNMPPNEENEAVNSAIYKLPENDSIYHRAAQLMQPTRYETDYMDDIERRSNETGSVGIDFHQSLSNDMTYTHSSSNNTKEQRPAFVSKKNKINDLASQLLSAKSLKENQTKISGHDSFSLPLPNDSSIADSVSAGDVSQNDHLELPQGMSKYHRAAQHMHPTHSKNDLGQLEMSELLEPAEHSPSLSSDIPMTEMTDNQLGKQRDIQVDPSVNCGANNSSDLHVGANLDNREQVCNHDDIDKSINSAPIRLVKESVTDKKIDNIAAQLISTQMVKSQSVNAEVCVTSLSFEEEIRLRKQKRDTLVDSFSTAPVKASITSICRPLQRISSKTW